MPRSFKLRSQATCLRQPSTRYQQHRTTPDNNCSTLQFTIHAYPAPNNMMYVCTCAQHGITHTAIMPCSLHIKSHPFCSQHTDVHSMGPTQYNLHATCLAEHGHPF
jgi:hypothetical protein